MRLLLLLTLVLSGCRAAADADAPPFPDDPASTPAEAATYVSATDRVRGLTLDARDEPAPEVLVRLADLGVTHVALIPFAFQERHDDPALRFHTDPGWYSESSRGARALAAAGDTLGFDVVLKPQLWLGHDPDQWSATIGFETEADWQAWEARYRAYILHHARMAAEIGSPLFVIGTELARSVREREAFWRSLIADVRAVYPGDLTYAANWYEDFEHVPFWDALDYVGVQAYFPLAEHGETDLTAERLQAAWASHEDALRRVSDASGKPVLFTEVGYRSVGYAAAEPWRWPDRDETAAPDPALQRALFEAMFATFWEEPWFAGTLVWKWPYRSAASRRRWGEGARLGYAIEGTPSEQVMADWYHR